LFIDPLPFFPSHLQELVEDHNETMLSGSFSPLSVEISKTSSAVFDECAVVVAYVEVFFSVVKTVVFEVASRIHDAIVKGRVGITKNSSDFVLSS
jgi:hypothetical protein